MRAGGREAAEKRDGLELELFFVPPAVTRFASALMSWPAIRAFERLGYSKRLAEAQEGRLIRSSPAVCLLTATEGSHESYLRGGFVFEQIALTCALRGLALQPHSAAIELGLASPSHAASSVPAQWREEIDAIRGELTAAFRCSPGDVPVACFRLGKPTRTPAHASQRRALRVDGPRTSGAFYEELTSRNRPAIDASDQAVLQRSRFLFAGCGSIGGAPVEPLVRLGATDFLLADPGSFELNNLNRQAATVGDIGRNKAEVLRERVLAVNPNARVLVEAAGVNAKNVGYLVGASDVVIDGVDVTEAPGICAKRLLHEEARRQRRQVIVGLDLGGTQLFRLYDYRASRAKAFDGLFDRYPLDARLSPRAFLTRLLSPFNLPLEMVTYSEGLLRGQAAPAPQLAPTASLFGVLASWAALDIAAGRPVRHEVSIDAPGLLMPRGRWLRTQGKRLAGMIRLKRLMRQLNEREP